MIRRRSKLSLLANAIQVGVKSGRATRAVAEKKRPQRGGAGAVIVGVTYAEGVGMHRVNATASKSFPSRHGDPGPEPAPAGTFRYASGTF